MSFIQENFDLSQDPTKRSETTISGRRMDFSDMLFLAMEVCKVPASVLLISENKSNWKTFALGIGPEEIRVSRENLEKLTELEKDVVSHSQLSSVGALSERYSKFVVAPIGSHANRGKNEGLLFLLSEKDITLNVQQEKALRILTHQILQSIESIQQKEEYERVQKALEQKYQDLEKFASVVSHDIKSPLANIISLTELLKEENSGKLSGETLQYLEFLEESSQSLRNYVDGLLIFYRSEKILEKKQEDVDLEPFFREISRLYTMDPSIEIKYPPKGTLHNVNRSALYQIFINLLGNALKYNFSKVRKVRISFEMNSEFYTFSVADNGHGFPDDQKEKIFELFSTLDQNDRNGNPGSGIGLATVKKLVESMGGNIRVESVEGKGSTFSFTIKR